MAVLDLTKKEILNLNENMLEEMIFRLASAETRSFGYSTKYVTGSGLLTSPDGGIDVYVDIPDKEFSSTNFLARSKTAFQVKRTSMPPSKVHSEMTKGNKLRKEISELATKKGSYIIVSLKDDCGRTKNESRLDAMKNAMKDDKNANHINLEFFDVERILLWARDHPGVLLWVREVLNIGKSGWKPFGNWSRPNDESEHPLILAPGISIHLPGIPKEATSIKDSIEPIRDAVRKSKNTIRVIGMSGVGKTRLVQSLFEEAVGKDALNRDLAIYVDLQVYPNCSPAEMIDYLLCNQRKAIIVLDNCSSDVHLNTANQISNTDISLISIGYAVNQDQPQDTQIIGVEASGTGVAESILKKEFGEIDDDNMLRIARLSEGNAKLAIILAKGFEYDTKLIQLRDDEFFRRLFRQGNNWNDKIERHASVLSLLASFSTLEEKKQDDLSVLGLICRENKDEIYRSVSILQKRGLIKLHYDESRIYPHILANRFACLALDEIRVRVLQETFEKKRNRDILNRFSRRLGMVGHHKSAKYLARNWMKKDGIFGKLSELTALELSIFSNLAPIVPDMALDRIAECIEQKNSSNVGNLHNMLCDRFMQTLKCIAYESDKFEFCVDCMIKLVEIFPDRETSISSYIYQLFQLKFSGTNASIDQKVDFIWNLFRSKEERNRQIGYNILSFALTGPPWKEGRVEVFGDRIIGVGRQENSKMIARSRSRYIGLISDIGLQESSQARVSVMKIFGDKFYDIWKDIGNRGKLKQIAVDLHHRKGFSVESWIGVRETIRKIYYCNENESRNLKISNNLIELERRLSPANFYDRFRSYVLVNMACSKYVTYSIENKVVVESADAAKELSMIVKNICIDFLNLDLNISSVCQYLFCLEHTDSQVYTFCFYLAQHTTDPLATWSRLVYELDTIGSDEFNWRGFAGYIAGIGELDQEHERNILDQCRSHPYLRSFLLELHPYSRYHDSYYSRCKSLLPDDTGSYMMFNKLVVWFHYSDTPIELVISEGELLLRYDGGDECILLILDKVLIQGRSRSGLSCSEIWDLGLKAATACFTAPFPPNTRIVDLDLYHAIERVVEYSLSIDGDHGVREAWLESIFDSIENLEGEIGDFSSAIVVTAKLMTTSFLDRIFISKNNNITSSMRNFLLTQGMHEPPLSGIHIDDLIDWCSSRDGTDHWEIIAMGIRSWTLDRYGFLSDLTEDAIRLINSSPIPDKVLWGCIKGRRSEAGIGHPYNDFIMIGRKLQTLVSDSNSKFSIAAKQVISEISRTYGTAYIDLGSDTEDYPPKMKDGA